MKSSSVSLLRKYFHNPAITTDIIVGFPGETEEEFRETVQFVNNGEIFANVLPVEDDEVFGMLRGKGIDGVAFQNALRDEWQDYATH